jgi:hypothetical protein
MIVAGIDFYCIGNAVPIRRGRDVGAIESWTGAIANPDGAITTGPNDSICGVANMLVRESGGDVVLDWEICVGECPTAGRCAHGPAFGSGFCKQAADRIGKG